LIPPQRQKTVPYNCLCGFWPTHRCFHSSPGILFFNCGAIRGDSLFCQLERPHERSVELREKTTPARIIHEASTAAADPGMFSGLHSFGLLDVLSSTPARASIAHLVSMFVFASLRILMNTPGWKNNWCRIDKEVVDEICRNGAIS